MDTLLIISTHVLVILQVEDGYKFPIRLMIPLKLMLVYLQILPLMLLQKLRVVESEHRME
ncbi:MAG: hypothetical protein CL557_11345 [Alphaproteobacteria bacterium]|nr:hypothetical protein [Alphaproteobacteria bacterium]